MQVLLTGTHINPGTPSSLRPSWDLGPFFLFSFLGGLSRGVFLDLLDGLFARLGMVAVVFVCVEVVTRILGDDSQSRHCKQECFSNLKVEQC